MNATRDPETILAAFLDEGPSDLPDATRRAILTALPTTPQVRRGSFAPWRQLTVNRYVGLAAVAVIGVVAIGLLSVNLLGGNGVGDQATPVASPSPTGAATSTQPALIEIQSANSAIAVSVTVPTSWTLVIDRPGYFFVGNPYPDPSREQDNEAPLIGIDVQSPTDVYADVCSGPAGGLLDPPLGPGVDDLVTWLASIEQLHATAPEPVTVGGAAGLTFDEGFLSGGNCQGGVALWPYDEEARGVYVNVQPAQKRYFVVDRDGTRVVVSIASVEGGFPLYLPEAQAVLGSLTFR